MSARGPLALALAALSGPAAAGEIPKAMVVLEHLGGAGGIGEAAAAPPRFVLMQDGTVWAWGNNEFGQLGDGTAANQLAPVLVVNEAV